MTLVLNKKNRRSEFTGMHSGVRRKFWGVCCFGGKAYRQSVNRNFHLTMAVLLPNSYANIESRNGFVTLSVIQHEETFLLCVLKHGDIQQVPLNLIFDKGDDVIFKIDGDGLVHLTGYQLMDFSDRAFNMDNELNCPVTAMKGDSDEDDVNDADFFIQEVETEESEEDSEDYDEDGEIDEEEVNDVMQDVDTDMQPRIGSQKRKKTIMPSSKRRMKKEDSESETNNNEVLSSEDGSNSYIGNTPTAKKFDGSPKAKKKSPNKLKKKKRLSEISNLNKSVKSDDANESSPHKKSSTPKLKKDKKEKTKHPYERLEGGVGYEDLIIGRGPAASDGNIVSIFYIGRLENKEIFDAITAPKKPYTFRLGASEVIKGLDMAIKGMKVGGKRRVTIPSNMGYGSKRMKDIPPNAKLTFSVELINVH